MHDNLLQYIIKQVRDDLHALTHALTLVHEDLQKHIDAVQESSNRQSERDKAPPVLRAELQIPESVIADHRSNEKKKNRRERFQLGVNVATLLVLAAYTLFTLRIMRASIDAALAAKDASNEAKQSRLQSENASHLDQRAWLGISNISGEPKLNEIWKIVVAYRNSGKTPLRNMSGYAVSEPVKKGGVPNFSYAHDAKITGAMIPPGGESHIATIIARHKDGTPAPVIQPMLDSINGEELHIYVHGLITYDDMFGCSHWMTYCYFNNVSTGGFSACSEHNDTGDEPCKK